MAGGSILRVAVAGGGIGGLAAAIALARAGHEVAVHERAAALGDVGAGLVLWTNAMRVLRRLGLAERVIEAGARIERGQVRRSDGLVLAESRPAVLAAELGEPTVAIHRAALHRALLDALPAGALRLGAECVGFDEDVRGVTVRLADGREDRADLLVGADGVRSAVRARLFPGVTLRYSGYAAWRGAVETEDESALGLSTETWGRGHRFGIVRLDARRVYWFATANTPAGRAPGPGGHKAALQRLFGSWHAPVPALVDATEEAAILYNDINDFAPMPRWSGSRVTLLGDAAHATTPNLGQGACMAVESAWVLADALSRHDDLGAALADYEARRRPRTAWITAQSRQAGRVGQWQGAMACSARNALVRSLPASATAARLRQVLAGGPC